MTCKVSFKSYEYRCLISSKACPFFRPQLAPSRHWCLPCTRRSSCFYQSRHLKSQLNLFPLSISKEGFLGSMLVSPDHSFEFESGQVWQIYQANNTGDLTCRDPQSITTQKTFSLWNHAFILGHLSKYRAHLCLHDNPWFVLSLPWPQLLLSFLLFFHVFFKTHIPANRLAIPSERSQNDPFHLFL